MLREKLSSSNGRFCLSRLKPISSYFTKKRLLLISFRGFLCRKLPLFQASFFLDFIFVSLFPILYLFLLLLCLTRGFSSSAVDCIFFFKVFYQLHFCPFFFWLHCFLHRSSQIQRRKSYFYYLRFISFSLFPPIFTFMLFAVEAQTIQSKVKRHVRVHSLFLFFFLSVPHR